MNTKYFRDGVRIICWSLVVGLVLIIVLAIIAPFGVSTGYVSGKDTEISSLGPNDRVETREINGEPVQHITDDLVYFSTEMPFKFDEAVVTITFSNPSDEQELYIGYKDQADWHYDTIIIDGLLNDRSWKRAGNGPFLYQREQRFDSLASFLQNPPKDEDIGTYDFDESELPAVTLSDYKSTDGTVIDTPLRGKVVFYTYIENEPFDMTIAKQDLNWYEDVDPVPVKIYKEDEVVYETTIPDDGIADASKKVGIVQEERIQNPGEEFPEAGVYKIEIGAGGDTLIKRITTKFHKLMFEGPLLPAANAEVYRGIIEETTPTYLYTDAKLIKATTYHPETIQSIQMPYGEVDLTVVNEPVVATGSASTTAMTIPKSDVILESLGGYFFFDQSHYFSPFAFPFIPLTRTEELSEVEYVISNYIPPVVLGDWKVATHTFSMTDANISDKKLSWLIKAPRLKELQNTIAIKK